MALSLTAFSPHTTDATGTFCKDDPIGDFIGEPITIQGGGPGLPDILQVCAESDGSDFTLTVEFNEPIVPPPSNGEEALGGFHGAQDGGGGPINAVAGFIDFDTDQNPGTWLGGPVGNVTESCPDPSGMGIDAYAGVFDGDTIAFFNSNGVFAFPMTFTSTSFLVTFPLSELGGDTDLNFGLVLGNLELPTDCFPGEQGFVTPFEGKEPPPTSTPTPTEAVIPTTTVGPTATAGITALPATGGGSHAGGSAVLWGLVGASAGLAGAAGTLAVRRRA